MKKLILTILGLALAGGLFYFFTKPTADETKTMGEPEMITAPAVSQETDLTTIESELTATELEDFEKEINELDQSINQL